MSSDATYTKGGCTHCGGHIEFPREALGAQVACPHCSATTELLENLAAAPAPVVNEAPPPLPKANPPAAAPKPGTTKGSASFARDCPGCGLEVSVKAEACPACGAILRDRKGLNLKLVIPMAVVVIAAAGFFAVKSGKVKLPSFGGARGGEAAAATPGAAPKPAAPPKPVKRTGKFELLSHKIEKTAGSSLMYVTGAVRNDTDKQKFSVRVTFALTDKGGKSAGEATDYITVIEPGDTWNFRALILDSAAENAKLTALDAENP